MGYSVFGAGLALAGFFLVFPCLASTSFTAGGALDPGAVEEHRTLLLTAYGLMFVGFGCKAGLLPMQSWLTAAHPVAPALSLIHICQFHPGQLYYTDRRYHHCGHPRRAVLRPHPGPVPG